MQECCQPLTLSECTTEIGCTRAEYTTMKHPDRNIETFEYNLGKAPTLRCVHAQQTTVCGTCEACVLTKTLNVTKSWFLRSGDQSQQRFCLGLVRRLHSVDLIQYVINLLQPLLCKDFTYARMRTAPSLSTDRASMSCDRALCPVELERNIAEIWYWFQDANYWTKSNFLMRILRCCSAHLLHTIGTHARTLLSAEQKAFLPRDDYESGSIASSSYSFTSTDHPELDLLSTVASDYSPIKQDPFNINSGSLRTPETPSRLSSIKIDSSFDVEIINDDSDGESYGSDDMVDPTCMVIPGSSKAYAGVSKYKDFIRCLPVHLSKYILGLLDQVSLFNAVCVSKHWRLMGEEAHKEYYVNQQVREEVMLMQGAAANGCNPLFAKDIDVAVPNIALGTWEAIKTEENVIETTFKSEVSFFTGYSGYSTRNIIMEERNVYCGAYNVMVLTNVPDPSRVVNTCGGKLIALGSQDRRVSFLNTETGQGEPPTVSGHAGSVRCVALAEKDGYVLSGSYDTSIRKWSLETGKCQKIFRGHRDTVLCMKICNDKIVSGGKDNMCKVWLLETGKCIRTFKHRHPITAVAMGEDPLPEIVISGCEGGKVKVWDLKTGKIIKRLSGHHSPVTEIKFDRWHIITGSKDGYALVWSSQGDHARCLTALRHPKEVLCLEFMYLRVITGSADGKLRIWNMVTAQCLRIMRGNSRSDPIDQLIAIDNLVTINTSHNLLVLNFEPVNFDYTLENDTMPPLVQYSKYSDAPVRSQPYPYVRAQRMKTAGATNQKIVYHENSTNIPSRSMKRPKQIPQSAKGLSKNRMDLARRIQSASGRLENLRSPIGQFAGDSRASSRMRSAMTTTDISRIKKSASVHSHKSLHAAKPPDLPARPGTVRSRVMSSKSGTSVVSVGGFQIGKKADEDSDITEDDHGDLRRRVSWAFDNPLIPQAKDISLNETKSLFRSQMRAQGDIVPPDFIYLSVNAIHANMKPSEASKNMETNRRQQELLRTKQLGRPSSSPSRMDPRTKVPVDELNLDQFMIEQGYAPREPDMKSEADSKLSLFSQSSKVKSMIVDEIPAPTTTVIITQFAPKPIEAKPNLSLHSTKTKSSIPKPHLLRPHTATIMRDPVDDKMACLDANRPKSAAVMVTRPNTAKTTSTVNSIREQSVQKPDHKTGIRSSGVASSAVPMVMYSKDMKEKLEVIKQERAIKQAEAYSAMVDNRYGSVSPHNDPMRNHANFRLYTNDQVAKQHARILSSFQADNRVKMEELERKQKMAWLARVKGITDKDLGNTSRITAPEIREYSEIENIY